MSDDPLFMPNALGVLKLVSGMSKPARDKQKLLMLQAYFDESTASNPATFVMAGFIAEASAWAKFSDEWRNALEMKPRLRWFKFSDAAKMEGEFSGWLEDRRDERIRVLHRIISDHALLSVCAILDHESYVELLGERPDLPKQLKNPYYFLVGSVVDKILQHVSAENKDEKIKFIFDERVMDKALIVKDWDIWRAIFSDENTMKIDGNPSFADDEDTLPLQAADLLAGQLRMWTQEGLRGETRTPLPTVKSAKEVPLLGSNWFRNDLIKVRDKWAARGSKLGALYGGERLIVDVRNHTSIIV